MSQENIRVNTITASIRTDTPLEAGVCDAILMCINEQADVMLKFNTNSYLISYSQLINPIIQTLIPE